MKVTGKIKLINELETFDSGFTKRTFVVTTEEQYPQDVILETLKDKTSLLDGKTVGDAVDVSINIRGNEFNGKYYVNLQAWRIEAATESNFEGIKQEEPGELDPTPVDADDLPF